MACSTFFFADSEELEKAVLCLKRHSVEFLMFRPSCNRPLLNVLAASVDSESSSKARDVLLSDGIQIVGCYDLPGIERPLPVGKAKSDAAGSSIISKMCIDFIDQCFADTEKIRIIVRHDADIASLLPYLNSSFKAAQYNPEIPVLCFKKGARLITLYRDKIGIAKADDLLDVWECLKDVKEQTEWVNEHKDEIVPNFDVYTPPSALDVYKLLPRINCSECGKPTCMAFAAAIANGETEADMCLPLMKTECAEGRNELLRLLGEAP